MPRLLTPLLLMLLLLGCSSKPVLPTEGAELELSAAQAVAMGESAVGKRVVWGGVIIASSNLQGQSRLEVLAYPLNEQLRPQTGQAAGSRFIAHRAGYLETVDYAPGRQVTLVGTVGGTEQAQLGEHNYTYPLIDAEQIHLWPKGSVSSEPKVRFGIGVMFRN